MNGDSTRTWATLGRDRAASRGLQEVRFPFSDGRRGRNESSSSTRESLSYFPTSHCASAIAPSSTPGRSWITHLSDSGSPALCQPTWSTPWPVTISSAARSFQNKLSSRHAAIYSACNAPTHSASLPTVQTDAPAVQLASLRWPTPMMLSSPISIPVRNIRRAFSAA